MTRFYGLVGYGTAVEGVPGVFTDVITERPLYGSIEQNIRQLRDADETLNSDITVQNVVSVVADAYAMQNFHDIRYVLWMGARWKVSSVDVDPPRLKLRLGEVYNGPTPGTP